MKSIIFFFSIILIVVSLKSSLDDLNREETPIVDGSVQFPGSGDPVDSFPNPYPDHSQPKTRIKIIPVVPGSARHTWHQIYASRPRRTLPELEDLLKKLQDSIDIPVCGPNAELPKGYECCTWRTDPGTLRCIKH